MSVPSNFTRHQRTSPLTSPWEPIFACYEIGKVKLGLEIRVEHCNSRGLLHGGLIAALADNAMGLSMVSLLGRAERRPERGLVTTSLSVDFLGRASLGQWLEVDTSFIHAGRRQGVAQAFIKADGAIIARSNANFTFDARPSTPTADIREINEALSGPTS